MVGLAPYPAPATAAVIYPMIITACSQLVSLEIDLVTDQRTDPPLIAHILPHDEFQNLNNVCITAPSVYTLAVTFLHRHSSQLVSIELHDTDHRNAPMPDQELSYRVLQKWAGQMIGLDGIASAPTMWSLSLTEVGDEIGAADLTAIPPILARLALQLTFLELQVMIPEAHDQDVRLVSLLATHCPRLTTLRLGSQRDVRWPWVNAWTRDGHHEADMTEVCAALTSLHGLERFGYHHESPREVQAAQAQWVSMIATVCPRLQACMFGMSFFVASTPALIDPDNADAQTPVRTTTR